MGPRYFQTNSPFCLLKVTGEDSFNFLQGQFTADLRPLEAEDSDAVVYGLFLDNRGKMVADAYVRRSPEGFLLYGPTVETEVLWQRLDDYLIADEVELEDLSSSHAVVTTTGEASPDFAAKAYAFPSRRWPPPATDWLFLQESGKTLITTLEEQGFTSATEDEVVKTRVIHQLPRVPQDTGKRLLPQEAGFENAVCYTKGCFLGQEVMARFKNFGSRRKGLFPVKLEGSVWPQETPFSVLLGDKKGGEMVSLAKCSETEAYGFAMLPLNWSDSEATLSIEAGQEVSLTLLNQNA